MQRSLISENDTWDLTKYYKNEKEYNEEYACVLKLLDKIVAMQEHIMDNANSIYDYLMLDDELSVKFERIYVYSYLYHYQDQKDEIGKKLKDKADRLEEEIATKTAFVKPEILKVKYETVKKYIKEDKRLEKYAFFFEKFYRYENHSLSEKEEQIINLASNAFGTPEDAFSAIDNADVDFGSISIDGKEVEISHSNYVKLMNNKNQDIRKKVFQKYYEYYIKRINTISELYKGEVKENHFFSKVYKYDSPLHMSLYHDAIDVSVYKNLIASIHDNLKPMYDYIKFRKEFLKLDEMHMYDLYVDLVNDDTKTFTFEEAKNIILEALKPLGSDYVNDLKKAFNEQWIDKYPNDGKRSGAYQWGSFGVTPFVSVNFDGTKGSVSTLAHELGHAMHSYYSDASQDYVYAQYPIFLAEIASTVNEVLLNDYLVKNAKDDKEKLLYITTFLDEVRTTIYRQTMFAEFESIIHDKEENGIALTSESISETYYELNKLYYGDDVISDEEIKYEWARIPHFYNSFYVYKYATGLVSALAIASDILSGKVDARENYLKFLSNGSSKYPLDTLKICGVDMNSKDTILKAIEMFENKLKEAKELAKKVENNGK